MIVLLPSTVADALIRCTADLRRVAVTQSIKAPPGYIRFDDAVAEVMKATSGPEHKVRAALRHAIADGELTAHDHEIPRLKLSSPDGPEDHHVVSEVALKAWIDQPMPQVSTTVAEPASCNAPKQVAEVAQKAVPEPTSAVVLGTGVVSERGAISDLPSESSPVPADDCVEEARAQVDRWPGAVEDGKAALVAQYGSCMKLPTYRNGLGDPAQKVFTDAAKSRGPSGDRGRADLFRALVVLGELDPSNRRRDAGGRPVSAVRARRQGS